MSWPEHFQAKYEYNAGANRFIYFVNQRDGVKYRPARK